MANELNRIFEEIADLRRRMGSSSHPGVVDEVKGDKMRVNWGKNPKGEPVLSPWLDTSDHRGGARERRFFKKGQNVSVATVNGDMNESATVSADAPNKKHKAPDHADDAGKESETYQLGETHVTKTKDTYDMFLQEEEKEDDQQQDQGGGGGGGQQQQQQEKKQKKKPEMKMRMNKKGGLTGRVGDGDDAARFSAHKDGAKLRIGDTWLVVTKGKIYSSHPIEIGKDPIPNDND